jgi:hypothetical protein
MAIEKTLGKTLTVSLMLSGGYVALRIGYLVANAANSDDLLGLQEALVGGAVAAGILGVMSVAVIAVARRFGLSMRRDLARLSAWVLVIPAEAARAGPAAKAGIARLVKIGFLYAELPGAS